MALDENFWDQFDNADSPAPETSAPPAPKPPPSFWDQFPDEQQAPAPHARMPEPVTPEPAREAFPNFKVDAPPAPRQYKTPVPMPEPLPPSPVPSPAYEAPRVGEAASAAQEAMGSDEEIFLNKFKPPDAVKPPTPPKEDATNEDWKKYGKDYDEYQNEALRQQTSEPDKLPTVDDVAEQFGNGSLSDKGARKALGSIGLDIKPEDKLKDIFKVTRRTKTAKDLLTGKKVNDAGFIENDDGTDMKSLVTKFETDFGVPGPGQKLTAPKTESQRQMREMWQGMNKEEREDAIHTWTAEYLKKAASPAARAAALAKVKEFYNVYDPERGGMLAQKYSGLKEFGSNAVSTIAISVGSMAYGIWGGWLADMGISIGRQMWNGKSIGDAYFTYGNAVSQLAIDQVRQMGMHLNDWVENKMVTAQPKEQQGMAIAALQLAMDAPAWQGLSDEEKAQYVSNIDRTLRIAAQNRFKGKVTDYEAGGVFSLSNPENAQLIAGYQRTGDPQYLAALTQRMNTSGEDKKTQANVERLVKKLDTLGGVFTGEMVAQGVEPTEMLANVAETALAIGTGGLSGPAVRAVKYFAKGGKISRETAAAMAKGIRAGQRFGQLVDKANKATAGGLLEGGQEWWQQGEWFDPNYTPRKQWEAAMLGFITGGIMQMGFGVAGKGLNVVAEKRILDIVNSTIKDKMERGENFTREDFGFLKDVISEKKIDEINAKVKFLVKMRRAGEQATAKATQPTAMPSPAGMPPPASVVPAAGVHPSPVAQSQVPTSVPPQGTPAQAQAQPVAVQPGQAATQEQSPFGPQEAPQAQAQQAPQTPAQADQALAQEAELAHKQAAAETIDKGLQTRTQGKADVTPEGRVTVVNPATGQPVDVTDTLPEEEKSAIQVLTSPQGTIAAQAEQKLQAGREQEATTAAVKRVETQKQEAAKATAKTEQQRKEAQWTLDKLSQIAPEKLTSAQRERLADAKRVLGMQEQAAPQQVQPQPVQQQATEPAPQQKSKDYKAGWESGSKHDESNPLHRDNMRKANLPHESQKVNDYWQGYKDAVKAKVESVPTQPQAEPAKAVEAKPAEAKQPAPQAQAEPIAPASPAVTTTPKQEATPEAKQESAPQATKPSEFNGAWVKNPQALFKWFKDQGIAGREELDLMVGILKALLKSNPAALKKMKFVVRSIEQSEAALRAEFAKYKNLTADQLAEIEDRVKAMRKAPMFWSTLEGAIIIHKDNILGMKRAELRLTLAEEVGHFMEDQLSPAEVAKMREIWKGIFKDANGKWTAEGQSFVDKYSKPFGKGFTQSDDVWASEWFAQQVIRLMLDKQALDGRFGPGLINKIRSLINKLFGVALRESEQRYGKTELNKEIEAMLKDALKAQDRITATQAWADLDAGKTGKEIIDAISGGERMWTANQAISRIQKHFHTTKEQAVDIVDRVSKKGLDLNQKVYISSVLKSAMAYKAEMNWPDIHTREGVMAEEEAKQTEVSPERVSEMRNVETFKDALKKAGPIISISNAEAGKQQGGREILGGEMRRLWENPKLRWLFRNDGKPLGLVRENLEQLGYYFETEHEMLSAIEKWGDTGIEPTPTPKAIEPGALAAAPAEEGDMFGGTEAPAAKKPLITETPKLSMEAMRRLRDQQKFEKGREKIEAGAKVEDTMTKEMFEELAPKQRELFAAPINDVDFEDVKAYIANHEITGEKAVESVKQEAENLRTVQAADGTPYQPDLFEGQVPVVENVPTPRKVSDLEKTELTRKAFQALANPSLSDSEKSAAWKAAFDAGGGTVSYILSSKFKGEPKSWPVYGAIISSPQDVMALAMMLRSPYQESLKVLFLDSKHRVLNAEIVTLGLLDQTLLHAREVFRGAPKGTMYVILSHNHPGGDVSPSADDVRASRELEASANVLGYQVLDHVITDDWKYSSMKSLGMQGDNSKAFPVPPPPGMKQKEWKVEVYPKEGRMPAEWSIVPRETLVKITNPQQLANVARFLRQGNTEVGHAILIDTRNQIVAIHRFDLKNNPVSISKEVLRAAVKNPTSRIILDIPQEKRLILNNIMDAGRAAGIPVIDALVGGEQTLPSQTEKEAGRIYEKFPAPSSALPSESEPATEKEYARPPKGVRQAKAFEQPRPSNSEAVRAGTSSADIYKRNKEIVVALATTPLEGEGRRLPEILGATIESAEQLGNKKSEILRDILLGRNAVVGQDGLGRFAAPSLSLPFEWQNDTYKPDEYESPSSIRSRIESNPRPSKPSDAVTSRAELAILASDYSTATEEGKERAYEALTRWAHAWAEKTGLSVPPLNVVLNQPATAAAIVNRISEKLEAGAKTDSNAWFIKDNQRQVAWMLKRADDLGIDPSEIFGSEESFEQWRTIYRESFPRPMGMFGTLRDVADEAMKLPDVKMAAPSEDINLLRAAFDRYDDTGESTIEDLVDEVEFLAKDANDEKVQALADAVEAFRQEQRDDRELAGRGDLDEAGEQFIAAVKSVLGSGGIKMAAPAASMQESGIKRFWHKWKQYFDSKRDIAEDPFQTLQQGRGAVRVSAFDAQKDSKKAEKLSNAISKAWRPKSLDAINSLLLTVERRAKEQQAYEAEKAAKEEAGEDFEKDRPPDIDQLKFMLNNISIAEVAAQALDVYYHIRDVTDRYSRNLVASMASRTNADVLRAELKQYFDNVDLLQGLTNKDVENLISTGKLNEKEPTTAEKRTSMENIIANNIGSYMLRIYQQYLDPNYRPTKEAYKKADKVIQDKIQTRVDDFLDNLNKYLKKYFGDVKVEKITSQYLKYLVNLKKMERTPELEAFARGRAEVVVELRRMAKESMPDILADRMTPQDFLKKAAKELQTKLSKDPTVREEQVKMMRFYGEQVGRQLLRVKRAQKALEGVTHQFMDMAADGKFQLDLTEADLARLSEGIINEILDIERTTIPPSGGKIGQDRSSFKMRKDIDVAIRELKGEVKNPLVRFDLAIAKMGRVMAQNNFWNGVIQQQESLDANDAARWLFRNQPSGGAYVKLTSEKLGPLQGYYTTQQIADEINGIIKVWDLGWWDNVNSILKAGVTAWNLPTHLGNILGNQFFMAADDVEVFTQLPDALKELIKQGDAYRAALAEGIIGNELIAGELAKAAIDNQTLVNLAGEATTVDKLLKALKLPFKTAEKLYAAEDQVVKLAAFMYHRKKMDDRKAAARVMQFYPDYDRVPIAVRTMGKIPIGNNFVSFFFENLRVAQNHIAQAVNDLATEGNRSRGVVRFAKMAILFGLAPALRAMRIGGDDDKDKQWNAYIQMLPYYQRASLIVPIYGDDGQLASVWDTGPLFPWQDLHSIPYSLWKWAKGDVGPDLVVKQMRNSGLQMNLLTHAFMTLYALEDPETGQKYNGRLEAFINETTRFFPMLFPFRAPSIGLNRASMTWEPFYQAFNEEVDIYGRGRTRTQAATNLLRIRTMTVNLPAQFRSHMKQVGIAMRDAEVEMSRNTEDKSGLIGASPVRYAQAEKRRLTAWKKALDGVNLGRDLGLSDKDIRSALNDIGFGNILEKDMLIKGKEEPPPHVSSKKKKK